MRVYSIFRSFDGESNGFSGPGESTTFVRLAGCNLVTDTNPGCVGCDTKYAQDADAGREMSVTEVLDRIHTNKITITGGEPLLQWSEGDQNLEMLVDKLVKERKKITIETNGSMALPHKGRKGLRFIVDWKLPSSGQETQNLMDNIYLMDVRDVFKFVVRDRKDFDRATQIIRGMLSGRKKAKVSIGCIWNELDLQTLWTWVQEEKLDVQLNIQLHKMVWGDDSNKVEDDVGKV